MLKLPRYFTFEKSKVSNDFDSSIAKKVFDSKLWIEYIKDQLPILIHLYWPPDQALQINNGRKSTSNWALVSN